MSDYSDPGIPTLTQRAESAPTPAAPATIDSPRRSTDDFPVLTDIDESAGQDHPLDIEHGADTSAVSAASTHSALTSAVLRAALQAELERALDNAVEEASIRLRARLEAELPALIDRAVNQVRPG